jgi:hypothetical protein
MTTIAFLGTGLMGHGLRAPRARQRPHRARMEPQRGQGAGAGHQRRRGSHRLRHRGRMARMDLRLMVEEAARGGQTLAVIPALAALLDQGIARGEGGLGVAAAVRVQG